MCLIMKKILYLVGSVFLLIISIILSDIYRPYIYRNNIFDFHFADTIGNLFAVPCITLLLLGVEKYNSPFKAILYTALILTIYEIIPLGTFDYYDLIATYISGLLTYLVFFLIEKFT